MYSNRAPHFSREKERAPRRISRAEGEGKIELVAGVLELLLWGLLESSRLPMLQHLQHGSYDASRVCVVVLQMWADMLQYKCPTSFEGLRKLEGRHRGVGLHAWYNAHLVLGVTPLVGEVSENLPVKPIVKDNPASYPSQVRTILCTAYVHVHMVDDLDASFLEQERCVVKWSIPGDVSTIWPKLLVSLAFLVIVNVDHDKFGGQVFDLLAALHLRPERLYGAGASGHPVGTIASHNVYTKLLEFHLACTTP